MAGLGAHPEGPGLQSEEWSPSSYLVQMPLRLGLEGLHLAVVSQLQAPNPPRPEAGGRFLLTSALGEHKEPPDHKHTHLRKPHSVVACAQAPDAAELSLAVPLPSPPRGTYSLLPEVLSVPRCASCLPAPCLGSCQSCCPASSSGSHGESPTLLLSGLEARIPDLASILPVQKSRGVRAGPPGLVKGPPACPRGAQQPSSPCGRCQRQVDTPGPFPGSGGNQEARQLVMLLANVGRGLVTTSEGGRVRQGRRVCGCAPSPRWTE